MSVSRFGNRRPRTGLSLLELVVVMGILAMMATLAVRSLEPIADQIRFEKTSLVLDDLKNATIAPSGLSNSIVQRNMGWIADMGQVPGSLDDFLTKPVGKIDHTLQWFDSDRDSINDVAIASGWRGPYFQLGAGQTNLVDGWGHSFVFQSTLGNLHFKSLGSDNDSLPPELDYAQDISVDVASSAYHSELVFRLFAIDTLTGTRIDPSLSGTQALGLLFYAANANGGTDASVEEQQLSVSAALGYQKVRTSTFIGPAAVRAILFDDTNSDQLLTVGETILKKSVVHHFSITPGAMRIEMELR